MRVAISADLHLTRREDHPERFEALEDILRQCGQAGVQALVLAGDLFDQSLQNYGEFEAAYQEAADPELQVVILPGNHDAELTSAALSSEGLAVIQEPQLMPLGPELQLLLVPYAQDKTMGEAIAPFADQLPPDRWILIGHGDWAQGLRSPDPYEPGVYMPLTKADLEAHRPAKTLLGHIHRPHDGPLVHYVGSPCPMNINETGLRRFLIYDGDTHELESVTVNSSRLYFNETFVMLPVDDEIGYLQDLIARRVAAWALPADWQDRVQVRVQVSGYTRDKSRVRQAVEEAFANYQFYEEEGPDLSELSHTADFERDHIAVQVKEWIENLEWRQGPAEPSVDEIMVQALKAIYRP